MRRLLSSLLLLALLSGAVAPAWFCAGEAAAATDSPQAGTHHSAHAHAAHAHEHAAHAAAAVAQDSHVRTDSHTPAHGPDGCPQFIRCHAAALPGLAAALSTMPHGPAPAQLQSEPPAPDTDPQVTTPPPRSLS